MGQDADTFDNLRGAILHQAVVGGDIGFAFGGVDNQVSILSPPPRSLLPVGNPAPPSRHAKLMNTLDQRFAGWFA
jgi:hypothetical protein